MAITINSTPESYPSAHDSMYFVVTSNNVSEVNFKYVFDVLINNTTVARIKLFPDPATTKGIFNVAGIVRDYFTNYFKPNTTQTAFSYTSDDISVTYEVRFGEEYDGTTYTNLASGIYKAYNFVNPIFRDFSTSYYVNFLDKWITSRDKMAMECAMGEKLYASFLRSAPAIGKQYLVSVESGSTLRPLPTGTVPYSGTSVQILYDVLQQGDPYLDANLNIFVNGVEQVNQFTSGTGYITVNHGDTIAVDSNVWDAWAGTGSLRVYIYNQTDGIMLFNQTIQNPAHYAIISTSFIAQGIVPVTLTVQKYLESGTPSGSSSTGGNVILSKFSLIDVSPSALNAYLGSSYITGSTYKYGVKINYGGASSDELMIKLVCNPRWTPVSIHFLNKLGGYDTFAFRLVNKREARVERKSYDQMGWKYNSGAMTRYDSYKKINAGNNTFAVNETVSFKLASDYINQTDYLWLKDLITSPEVYYEQGGYYYPVSIKTTSWEEKIKPADKMFNFELTVEFAQKINSQYR